MDDPLSFLNHDRVIERRRNIPRGYDIAVGDLPYFKIVERKRRDRLARCNVYEIESGNGDIAGDDQKDNAPMLFNIFGTYRRKTAIVIVFLHLHTPLLSFLRAERGSRRPPSASSFRFPESILIIRARERARFPCGAADRSA